MAGHVVKQRAQNIFVNKPKGRRPHEKPKSRWEDVKIEPFKAEWLLYIAPALTY
jgi:elongation factor P hydroxylase